MTLKGAVEEQNAQRRRYWVHYVESKKTKWATMGATWFD